MRGPKIGVIGLGNIAQKAYLPILTNEVHWTLMGAFSPSLEKRQRVCSPYRIRDYSNLQDLTDDCDAVFVHSSTSSHYEVVSYCLHQGLHVYVDKPLAAAIQEAHALVDLANRNDRKLMVGFNRRFAPNYVQAKNDSQDAQFIRIDKHRVNRKYHRHYPFTLLDDYIHLVDTALWMAASPRYTSLNGKIEIDQQNRLLFAYHTFAFGSQIITTFMHREAGTNLEQLEVVKTGKILRVSNLETFKVEKDGHLQIKPSGSWDSMLERRGFVGAVHHFIDSIEGDTEPSPNGTEGLLAHRMVEDDERSFSPAPISSSPKTRLITDAGP